MCRVGVGQKQAMHSHSDHPVYPLSGYRVKHIAVDGCTSAGERRPGEVVWISTESHGGEYVRDTEIHVLIVESQWAPREQRRTRTNLSRLRARFAQRGLRIVGQREDHRAPG